jgi:predicted small metal-binding protein
VNLLIKAYCQTEMQCSIASPVFIISIERVVLTKKEDVSSMVSLNCSDLGMGYSFELNGTNERDVMRKFINYAETELKMPVLTADTIYRVQMAIKK